MNNSMGGQPTPVAGATGSTSSTTLRGITDGRKINRDTHATKRNMDMVDIARDSPTPPPPPPPRSSSSDAVNGMPPLAPAKQQPVDPPREKKKKVDCHTLVNVERRHTQEKAHMSISDSAPPAWSHPPMGSLVTVGTADIDMADENVHLSEAHMHTQLTKGGRECHYIHRRMTLLEQALVRGESMKQLGHVPATARKELGQLIQSIVDSIIPTETTPLRIQLPRNFDGPFVFKKDSRMRSRDLTDACHSSNVHHVRRAFLAKDIPAQISRRLKSMPDSLPTELTLDDKKVTVDQKHLRWVIEAS